MTQRKIVNRHVCQLTLQDNSGLPKLPPNAGFFKKLCRKLRKLIIVNPNNFRCKFLSREKTVILAEQRRHIKSRYFFMIHPLSNLNAFLEISFFLLWWSKMLAEPIVGNMIIENKVLERITDVIRSLQRFVILSFFLVGYMDPISKEIVIESKRVAIRYLKTYFFIDVLGTELEGMIDKMVMFLHVEDTYYGQIAMKCADHVHVFFLYLRLNTILTFMDNIGQMINMRKKVRKCIIYLIKTFMYLHVCCCMLYYIPQIVYLTTEWPEDSWIVQAQISPDEEDRFFKKYGESMMTTVCFFFGASTGKFYIQQTNEQICTTIIALFGRLYTLFLLADALNTFGISSISESRYESTLSQLHEYMLAKNLPSVLKKRMIRYYECKMQKHYFDEEEILNSLSENLRNEIYLFSARILMNKCAFFRYIPQSEIATLISMMTLVTYAPGDIIYSIDQHITDVFFISSGSVAMINREGVELCHLQDGEAFGICRSDGAHRLTVIAVETTDLFLMNKHTLNDFLEEFPKATLYLHGLAAERQTFYGKLQDMITGMKNSCLVELRTGKLLEKKKKRIILD